MAKSKSPSKRAKPIRRFKQRLLSGAIVEIKIWRLPEPTDERPHRYKYSLFYGFENRRVIGYGNERGKGDHRHINEREEAYVFVDLDSLLADFERDVEEEESNG